MRKPVALALVLLLAISYPLGMVDAQGGTIVITEFADGRENLVMQIEGSIGNSSVGVNVPKDAVVSRAVMEVGAVDHILERDLYLDDFDGVWGKEHSKFGVENEFGSLISRRETGSIEYSTEDGFANTTLDELDLKDGRLQLNTINGTWTQNGFQDGPGQNDWSGGQGFKESHHIDYTTREGSIRLLPKYEWTMLTDAGPGIPQPRGFIGMAINESESDIYIYGGTDVGFNNRYGDSYVMNVSLNSWDNLCNNCQPGVSYNNTLIWNGLNKSVQVVGGRDNNGVTQGLNWDYGSGGGWDQMMNIDPRSSHSHVFIPSDNISIVFGGRDAGLQADKTIFHYKNDQWTDMTSQYTNVPEARYGHSAVWDPDGRKMIVFGGQGSGTPMKDVHILDLDTKTWTSGSTPNLAARHSHTAVWDREARAMLVFGGNDGNQILRDLWMYWPSNDSWMQLPDYSYDRWGHGAVYSNSRGSMYVWGGYEDLSANGKTNSGMALEKNYADRESELYSSVFNAQERVLWTRLTFEGEGFGPGTNGKVELYYRVGDQPDPTQSDWSEWSGPFNETYTNLTDTGVLRGQYAQYRIVMLSTDRLHNLQIDKVGLYYLSHINEGHMTTDVLDLGIIPEEFTTLNLGGDSPSDTGWNLTIKTSEDGLTDWFEEVIYSLEDIQFAMTARFVKLTLTLWTNDSSATPFLDEMSLHYSYYNPEGFFTIPVDNEGKQVDWIFADWEGVENISYGGGPLGLVSVSVDGGMTWHILTAGDMWYNPEPDDRNITTSILINFTLLSEGDIPVLFFDFFMDYGLFSFPVDIKLDVGDDGKVDWDWPGLHWSGDNSMTADLSTEFQQYLVLNQGEASDADEIFIPLHFGAADECGIWLDKLEVSIIVDNYPPKITSDPVTEANVGYKYEYRFVAEDQDGDDLEFFLDVHPEGMILEQESHVLKWVPSNDQMGSQNVVLRVSDGTDESSQHFTINVSDSMKNEVPKFVSVPPDDINPMTIQIEVNAGKEYEYQIIVIDLDLDDLMRLEVTIFQGDKDMSIDSDLIFRWVAPPLDVGRTVDVTLLVSDKKAYSLQQFTMVVVEPANHPPFFVDEVPREFQLEGGKTFSYQVEAEDPEKKDLFYRVEDAPSWVKIGPKGLIVADPPNKDDRSTFTVIVSDGEDEVEAVVVFNVISQDDPRPPGPAEDDVRGAFILLGLLMIIVITVVAIMVARKRKAARTKGPAIPDPGPREMPDDGPLPGPTPGPGPDDGATPHPGPTTTSTTKAAAMGAGATAAAPAAKPTPPPAAAMDMRPEDKPIIEDVYLIYNDGRLIAHEARSIRPDMDEYVISSMLKAITDFVTDSLRREGSLGGLDYGDYRIVIEKGSYATLALVIIGKESSALREMVKRTLEKIQGLYSGVIEDWDGDTLAFSEVRNHLLPLILLGRTLEEDAQLGDVRVMSALEFYQGFVRLKVAIKNKYPYMVHDASLKLIYDKKALQLSHIEPEYNMEGMEVEIGNISPKEKKTVAFYLDPLICMESNIDASVMYKNYKGEIKTEMMKRRPVDIVCPIFYTEQNVNVAMLKRLINELKYRDSKLYSIPKGLTPELALSLAKETVQAHDVKFVREFEEQTPYMGEAWFYGKTKQTLEDLVIRVTVRADSNTMEMFVFSSNLATLPGLLADLAHGLKRGYKAKRSTKEDLSQITDTTVKDQLEKSSLLIDKYATSEMDTESDEIDI